MTQTIDQIKAEIAELKQQRELEEAKRELEQLKSGKEDVSAKDVRLAAVRQGIAITSHIICGPFAAGYYGSKTGYWTPVLASTGLAILSLPIALIDFGFTFAVAPPAAATVLLCTKSNEKRRKLGIMMPEQADAMMSKVTSF